MSRLVRSAMLVGLFVLAANAWAPPPGRSAPPSTDVKVKSFRVLPLEDVAARLEAARVAGEPWVSDPLAVALHACGIWPDSSGERRTLRIAVDGDGSESPRAITVTVVSSGLLDDSTAALWQQIRLERTSGVWRLVEHRTASQCWRGATGSAFVAEPCP